MFRRVGILVALAFVLAGPAYAFHCPKDMAAIDKALPEAQLSAEDKTKVEELRAKGEELHKAGNHAESVKVLAEAKEILKIE